MNKIEDQFGLVVEKKEVMSCDEVGEDFVAYKLVFVLASGDDMETIDDSTTITVRTKNKLLFNSFETMKPYKMSFMEKIEENEKGLKVVSKKEVN